MHQRRLGYETALLEDGHQINAGIIKELDPFDYKSDMKKAISDMVKGPKQRRCHRVYHTLPSRFRSEGT